MYVNICMCVCMCACVEPRLSWRPSSHVPRQLGVPSPTSVYMREREGECVCVTSVFNVNKDIPSIQRMRVNLG